MICEDCKCNMTEVDSCTVKYISIGGIPYERDTAYYDVNEHCHDCGIKNTPGNIHHFGCDIERCPRCDGQLISCDCGPKVIDNTWTTLKLAPNIDDD